MPTGGQVVVVGSANVDVVLRCAELPAPGETVHADRLSIEPGGKGANQAVAAARLGARVAFVGCVGDDAFGVQLRQALQAEGVDTRALRVVTGQRSGVASIAVDARGRNAILVHAGANAQLQARDVDAAAALLEGAALLVCQLESPLPAIGAAIQAAHALGVPVLLNPAPAQALPPDWLPRLRWLVPNEHEAVRLAGLAGSGPPAVAAAVQRLQELGAACVLATLGAGGVLLGRQGRPPQHLPAPPVQAVDTTGAGDCFVGAFAAAVAAGQAQEQAIAQAQRAAALSVTRHGAMASMPRADDPGLREPPALPQETTG